MSAQSRIEVTLPSDLVRRMQIIARQSLGLDDLVLEALEDFIGKHGPDPGAMEAHRASLVQFGDVYRKLADRDD
jgi:hypothetical protein